MAATKLKDENYYVIHGWMINKLGLKGVALSVYAIIYGFSQDGENEFTGSVQYLCDFCGASSRTTITKALNELVERKLIFKKETFINGVQFNRYRANTEIAWGVQNVDRGCPEIEQGGVQKMDRGCPEIEHNNKEYKKENIKNNNNNIYSAVVDFLNENAGTKYKSTSASSKKHISARIAEGFTIDDFKAVIEKKCAEWKGTDMEKYLRPETLFGTKFESYLNAPAAKPKNNGTQVINGKEYEYINGKYYVKGGSGIAVNPFATDELPF